MTSERVKKTSKPTKIKEMVWDERLKNEVAEIIKEHKTLLEELAKK